MIKPLGIHAVQQAHPCLDPKTSRLAGYKEHSRLITGAAQELEDRGLPVLDLERVRLEVPYREDALSWVWAEERRQQGARPILVPAQLAFLFTNLDEAGLTSGLSSTGLGAGATLEEARLSGLLEVIERDAERVVPFSPERAFVLEADEPRVKGMLSDLERKGIHIQFKESSMVLVRLDRGDLSTQGVPDAPAPPKGLSAPPVRRRLSSIGR